MCAIVVWTSLATVLFNPPDAERRNMTATTSRPAAAPQDLSTLLEPILAKHKLPALAGAIIAEGRVTAIGAVGNRRYGEQTPVTVEDCWHIGSCTKAMTATLVGTFVDEGKIAWNTTIVDVFPSLKDKIHSDYRAVTFEQLLAHRGGVPENLEADGLWGRLWKRQGSPTQQRMQLLEGVLFKPPARPPGTKYEYANAGYAIAGAMLEELSGKSWESLMEQRLFKPLGMKSAGFGAPGTIDKITQPQGHTKKLLRAPAPVPPGDGADNPPAIGPAGTVHCSIGDWAKFVADQIAGARGQGQLLKPETYRRIQTDVGDDYALGWIVTDRPWGGRVLTHAGSNTMWFAVTWLSPEKNFGVVVCTNLGGGDALQATDAAAWALIQHHLKNSTQPGASTRNEERR